MTDTETDLIETLKRIEGDIDSFLADEWDGNPEGWRSLSSTAHKAIERAEKGTPDLDLHDQVEAKRVNDCPDCETETDTTRNNGANGDEYVEYCMNDECEWEMKLGTVTESLS